MTANLNNLNRTDDHCQPCDDYRPHPDEGTFNVHECYRLMPGGGVCDMLVYYCACGADHHEGGWQTCKGTANPRAIACLHPACVTRRTGGVTP